MKRKLLQAYGPLLENVSELQDLLWISEQAFIRMSEAIGQDPKDWTTATSRIIQSQMYHAINTSFSIRILVTNGQALEAYALLRMRLEQVIVSSLLIHTPTEDGFDRFANDVGRVDYRAIQSLDKAPVLRNLIEEILGHRFNQAIESAIASELADDPKFDISTGKIKRKWTDLSTYDMAVRRDKMVKAKDDISSTRLTWFYVSLYRSSSILLHADTGAISSNYLSMSDKKEYVPQILYLFLVLIINAQLDILQCYEVSSFFDKPGKSKIAELKSVLEQILDSPLNQ